MRVREASNPGPSRVWSIRFLFVLERVFLSVFAIRGKSGSSHVGRSVGEEVQVAKETYGNGHFEDRLMRVISGKNGNPHVGRSLGKAFQSAKRDNDNDRREGCLLVRH